MFFHHRGGCFSLIIGIALLLGISHGVSKESSSSLLKEYAGYVEDTLRELVSGKENGSERKAADFSNFRSCLVEKAQKVLRMMEALEQKTMRIAAAALLRRDRPGARKRLRSL